MKILSGIYKGMQIKTSIKHLDSCMEIIIKHHNYDIPEVIEVDATILNRNYYNWFIDNLKK